MRWPFSRKEASSPPSPPPAGSVPAAAPTVEHAAPPTPPPEPPAPAPAILAARHDWATLAPIPVAGSVPLTITPGAFEASVAGVRDMLYRSPIPTRAPDAPSGYAGGIVFSGPPVAPPEAALDLPPLGEVQLPDLSPRHLTSTIEPVAPVRLTTTDHPALTFATPQAERTPTVPVPDLTGPMEWDPQRGFFNPNDPPPPPTPSPGADVPRTLRMLRPRGPRRAGLGEPISEDDYVEVEIPVPAPAPPPDEPPMLVELPEPEPEPPGPPKVRYVPVPGGRERVPDDLRSSMLHRFGVDPGARPVIRDVGATEQARMLHARAFVRNAEVYLPEDAGPLDDPEARHLLAHELTHVAQQEALGGQLPSESSIEGRALELAAQQVAAHLAGVPGADLPPVALVVPRSVPAVRRTVEEILTTSDAGDDLVAKGYASRASDGTLVYGPGTWVAAAGEVQRATTNYSWQQEAGGGTSGSFGDRFTANFGATSLGSFFSGAPKKELSDEDKAKAFEEQHKDALHSARAKHETELYDKEIEDRYTRVRREDLQGEERDKALTLKRTDAVNIRKKLDQDMPYAHLDYEYKRDLPAPEPTTTPQTTTPRSGGAGGVAGAVTTPGGQRRTTTTGTDEEGEESEEEEEEEEEGEEGDHPGGGKPEAKPSPHASEATTTPGARTTSTTPGARTTTAPRSGVAMTQRRGGGSSKAPDYSWATEDREASYGQRWEDTLRGSFMGGLFASAFNKQEDVDEQRNLAYEQQHTGDLMIERRERERELVRNKQQDKRRAGESPELTRDEVVAIREQLDSEMPLHNRNAMVYTVPLPAAEAPQQQGQPGQQGQGAQTPGAAAGGATAGQGTTLHTPGATGAVSEHTTPKHTLNHGDEREDNIHDRFAPQDLDRLAGLLYEKMRRHLRTELLVHRERTGTLSDHR